MSLCSIRYCRSLSLQEHADIYEPSTDKPEYSLTPTLTNIKLYRFRICCLNARKPIVSLRNNKAITSSFGFRARQLSQCPDCRTPDRRYHPVLLTVFYHIPRSIPPCCTLQRSTVLYRSPCSSSKHATHYKCGLDNIRCIHPCGPIIIALQQIRIIPTRARI